MKLVEVEQYKVSGGRAVTCVYGLSREVAKYEVAEYLALLRELLHSFHQLWLCSTNQRCKLREQSRVVG